MEVGVVSVAVAWLAGEPLAVLLGGVVGVAVRHLVLVAPAHRALPIRQQVLRRVLVQGGTELAWQELLGNFTSAMLCINVITE